MSLTKTSNVSTAKKGALSAKARRTAMFVLLDSPYLIMFASHVHNFVYLAHRSMTKSLSQIAHLAIMVSMSLKFA